MSAPGMGPCGGSACLLFEALIRWLSCYLISPTASSAAMTRCLLVRGGTAKPRQKTQTELLLLVPCYLQVSRYGFNTRTARRK